MSMEEINEQQNTPVSYTEENIRHLSDMEHVRTRPGMYIGRLGDGSQAEDGIYVLLKEVVDNCIDEFKMGAGKRIDIQMEDTCVFPCVTMVVVFRWEVWWMLFRC